MNSFETRYVDGSTVSVYDRFWADRGSTQRDVVVILRDAHNTIISSQIVKLPKVVA